MSNRQFLEDLKREFSGAVTKIEESYGQLFCDFEPSGANAVFTFCVHSPLGRFDFLEDMLAYDADKDIVVVYNLYSTVLNQRVFLKSALNRIDPKILSAASFWASAKHCEYEIAELWGVRFKNNELSTPFLLPAEWKGYPMRKDYSYPEGFDGIVHKMERRNN